MTGAILLLSLASSSTLAVPCDARELSDLRADVRNRFKNWKIVTTETLSVEDASQWQSKWGDECPGIASGNFDGSGQIQYAVLLISTRATPDSLSTLRSRGFRLIHVKNDGRLRYRNIDRSPTAMVPVVRCLPPGEYKYFRFGSDERSTLMTRFDTVLLEMLESSSYLYQIGAREVRRYTLSF